MNLYQEQWQYIHTAWEQGRVPQGLLFVGPTHCNIPAFTKQVARLLLCSNTSNQPCGTCNDCLMLEQDQHPDLEWIKPEKTAGSIKIDQIREMQNNAYLTPQRSKFRIIVIEAACRMNTAAANALLKILEEPAQHTLFILIAQQLNTVMPTILSRCQLLRFSISDKAYQDNILTLGEHYAKESEQAQILQESESILDDLIALIQGQKHPSALASLWTKFEITTFLWFMYLVFAQMQHMQFSGVKPSGVAALQLQKLSTLLPPVLIFSQLDVINGLLRKLGHNIHINHVLALEDMLFALTTE